MTDGHELETSAEGAEVPGGTIDRYRLLEPLGEGGFGTVYLAEQREPVRRRVALKVIKLGMDTKQVIARFDAERQALALMDHPGIARVLDGGATAAGRPYFVMDLVRGEPITRYCDNARLDTRGRLELFIDVCRAVQHAHQKGVIHRDLKPSNVLVTEHDGVATPKVIDFGIAKATDRELTEQTLYTDIHQFIGTPEYMSPEQAVPSRLDVDTRSDIYSLGVMLYELLTGSTPFANRDLRTKALYEIQRIIREEEPDRPSTRLSGAAQDATMGESADDIARQRRTDLSTLARSLRGDLDWIVMRCLDKDRTRRYAGAGELADDVRRHLDDRPVAASPPSVAYRFRKYARRHRVGFAGAALLVLALAVGAGGLTQGFVSTVRERDEKNEALEEARRQAAIATAVNEFLNEDLLAAADPSRSAGNLTVVDVLDEASTRIEDRFPDEPTVEASIRLTMAQTYTNLGRYGDARVHLDRALLLSGTHVDPDDSLALRILAGDGTLRFYEGDLEGSHDTMQDALARREETLGPDHPDTTASRGDLANFYLAVGQYEQSETLFREVWETQKGRLGVDSETAMVTACNLGQVLLASGQLEEAEAVYAETLDTQRRVLGDDHWDTINSMISLAELYSRIEHDDESERLFLEAKQQLDDRGTSDEHPRMMALLNNLGLLYLYTGRFAEAEPMFLQILEAGRRVEGERHRNTLNTMHNLGGVYFSMERWDEAIEMVGSALELRREVLGVDHLQTLVSQGMLARIYWKQGRHAEAAPLMIATWQGMSDNPDIGPAHPYTAKTAQGVAGIYAEWGKPDEATTWRERAENASP